MALELLLKQLLIAASAQNSAWRKTAISFSLIFFAFLITGIAGSALYNNTSVMISPAVIWAPFGIAVAAVVLEGYVALIPIASAALVLGLINGIPLVAILLSVAINTLQPLVALVILRHTHFDPHLYRIRDVAILLSVGVVATAVAPALRALWIISNNYMYGTAAPILFSTWWVGGALSVLVLAPLLITWISRARESGMYVVSTIAKSIESATAFTLLIVISVLLFVTPYITFWDISLFFPFLAILMWIALRFGIIAITAALFLMTVISLAGALFGTHPPATTSQTSEMLIFSVQVFDLLLVCVYYIIAAVEEQRKFATEKLTSHAEKLEDALSRLHREESAKNEFIAVLAHELRNPLALLDNSVHLTKLEFKDNPEGLELAEVMHERIRTMAHLLDDLLDISRITQKKFELRKEVVDMKVVIERTVKNVQSIMKTHGHTFRTTVTADNTTVVGDPVRLEQIMINLMVNAAKYTPEHGHIDLFLEHVDGWIVLRVKDNGIGIPQDMLKRVFEPFVQISRTRKILAGSVASLGVGLSVTKRLVELHGGSIEAKSAGLEQGSEFIVRLPEQVRQTPDLSKMSLIDRHGKLTSSSQPHKKFSILVVDDERAIADGFKKLLEKLGGHDVAVAYSGTDAIAHMKENAPEVVILDIGLPDIDGYEVGRAIKGMGKDFFLVAMSGYGQTKDKEKAKTVGFDEYLVKPAGVNAIEEVLRKIPK